MHPTPEEVFTRDLHTIALAAALQMVVEVGSEDLPNSLALGLCESLEYFKRRRLVFADPLQESLVTLERETTNLQPNDIALLCFLCLKRCADSGLLTTKSQVQPAEDDGGEFDTGVPEFVADPSAFDSDQEECLSNKFTQAALPFMIALGLFFPLDEDDVLPEEQLPEMIAPAPGSENDFLLLLTTMIATELERRIRLAQETSDRFAAAMRRIHITRG
jgi:hypothetical protein